MHLINLDRAPDRLAAVLAGFDRHLAGSGIALDRFAAIDARQAQARQAPGALAWAEKACFLSHAASLAVATRDAAGHPPWIIEDDVVFGPRTLARVRDALDQLRDTPWDILFTDLYVTNVHDMLELFQRQRTLAAGGRTVVLDLAGVGFAGATSYLVNPAAAQRVAQSMARCPSIDLEPSIWFKREACAGRLRCHAVFPFATTIADIPSQVQPAGIARELGWWNAYRLLLWEDSQPAQLDALLDRLEHPHTGFATDAHSARMARVVAGLLAAEAPPGT